MGLNQDLIKGRSKNVRIFGGAPENGKRIIDKVRESKLEEEKTCDYLQLCSWVIPKMEYLIQLPNIGRISYKENRHVNSLDLKGPKIHTIYLVELQKN